MSFLFYLGLSFNNTLDLGLDDTARITEVWQDNFDDVFSAGTAAGGTLFSAFANLGTVFALVAAIISGARLLQIYGMSHDVRFDSGRVVLGLLSFFMLADDYAGLIEVTRTLKSIINQVSRWILESTVAGARIDEIFQRIQGNQILRTRLQQAYEPCLSMAGQAQVDCLASAETTANTLANSLEGQIASAGDWISNTVSAFSELGNRILNGEPVSAVGLFAPLWKPILYAIMYWMMIAWAHLFEAAIFIVLLLAPLSVGGSLLIANRNALVSWAVGLFSMGLTNFLFYALLALSTSAASNGDIDDPAWFPIFVGAFAPLFAGTFGIGTGWAVWSSVSGTAAAVGGAATQAVSGVLTLGMAPVNPANGSSNNNNNPPVTEPNNDID